MENQSNWRAASGHEIETYLRTESAESRIKLLESWQKSQIGLPETIIKVLMELGLPDQEVATAFEGCVPNDKANFELWVMTDFLNWNQNIAAAALRAWARATERVLWHRLLPILTIPELPQRIRYTILEISTQSHAFEIVRCTLQCPGWEELSPAFQALLFERALELDLRSDRLVNFAKKTLKSLLETHHPDHKALFSAYTYLLRYCETDIDFLIKSKQRFLWQDLLESAHENHNRSKATLARLDKQVSKDSQTKFDADKLPNIWSRAESSHEIVSAVLRSENPSFKSLSGFSRNMIFKAAQEVNLDPSWSKHIISHLPLELLNAKLTQGTTHFVGSYDFGKYSLLNESRAKACKGQLTIAGDQIDSVDQFCAIANSSSETRKDTAISSVLTTVVNAIPDNSPSKETWRSLASGFREPSAASVAELSTICRKQKGLVHIVFIKLLSKMVGRDDAVLKLLDYIRSDDETCLRVVVQALSSINTPRSHLELIAMLTRPNSTTHVQQDIVALLSKKDLRDLQKELRSAVQDMKIPHHPDHPVVQIKDELSALITPVVGITRHDSDTFTVPTIKVDNLNLDQELSGMIPNYKVLSSEIKRALRTALFFNKTATVSEHADSIDLSPLIDMQYKAMELLYREFFEDMVSHSLQNGVIQRKLDVIGYARPIVRQMDEFEAYIASLPVVREIPFFSKFKLRKMLRSICQFEPGRRFTLDGLKAFGLYFFIFGRKNCKAGLANTLNVGATDDRELAELCKELHVFQDFRNRAAHEGFHPDASNDIQGIWRTSASVVQWAFKIKDAQKSDTLAPSKKAS